MSLNAQLDIHKHKLHLTFNASFQANCITGVMGPTGCGKTTLLRCLAGLERHSGAHIAYSSNQGIEHHWQNRKKFTPPHQRSLAYVIQKGGLLPHLTVEQNLRYPLRWRSNHQQRDIAQISSDYQLEHLLKQRPKELSGGEQQLVALARAAVCQPAVLLLDEPFSGLDKPSRHMAINALRTLQNNTGACTILVSHSATEIAQCCTEVLLLQQDKNAQHHTSTVRQRGSVATILTDSELGLAEQAGAIAVFDAQVQTMDTVNELLELELAGQCLRLADPPASYSNTIRLAIAATDVSISLAPQASSILNCLRAEIMAIKPASPSTVLIWLNIGDQQQPLLARISKLSVTELALQPGLQVWAQIKSVAIRH